MKFVISALCACMSTTERRILPGMYSFRPGCGVLTRNRAAVDCWFRPRLPPLLACLLSRRPGGEGLCMDRPYPCGQYGGGSSKSMPQLPSCFSTNPHVAMEYWILNTLPKCASPQIITPTTTALRSSAKKAFYSSTATLPEPSTCLN